MERTTRIVISAEVRLYREGIKLLLEAERDLDVVATPDSRSETVSLVTELRPELVLVDTAMPAGAASVADIRRASPDVKIVALGLPDSDPEIIACAEAGVSGFVTRDGSAGELVATIRSVARGETLCSPRVAARLLQRVAALAAERPAQAQRDSLTPRELEIVRLIDEGLSNKEIAGRLQIEVPTVKSHVHSILEKVGARRRGEAAARLRTASPLPLHPRI